MSPFEMVGLMLLALMTIAIIALLGPASLGALIGAGAAIGAVRLTGARK